MLTKVCMTKGQLHSAAPLGEHLEVQVSPELQTPLGLVHPTWASLQGPIFDTCLLQGADSVTACLMHYCMSCVVTGLVCALSAHCQTIQNSQFLQGCKNILNSYFVPTTYRKRVRSVNKNSRSDSNSHVVVGLLSGIYQIHHVLPLALPEENPKPTGVSRIFPLILTRAKMSSSVGDSKRQQLCKTLELDQPERGKHPRGSCWDRRQSPSWGVQAPLALCCFPPRQRALGYCCGQCQICHQSHKKTVCILKETIAY